MFVYEICQYCIVFHDSSQQQACIQAEEETMANAYSDPLSYISDPKSGDIQRIESNTPTNSWCTSLPSHFLV
jgi:hypothetical protein